MKEFDFSKEIEKVKGLANVIVENNEQHVPTLIAYAPDGAKLLQFADFNEKVKEIFKPAVTKVLREFNAFAYIFVCEAWAVAVPDGSELGKKLVKGEIRVSEVPFDDRVEIITLHAAENGGKYYTWTAKIKHLKDKRFIEKWEEIPGKELSGRMIIKEW